MALCAALALVFAVTQIGGTYATPATIEVMDVTLECESGIDPAYHVEVGQTQSFSSSYLWAAFSSDTKKATVDYTRGTAGTMRVTGVSAGVAVVTFGTNAGMISLLNYQITDSNNISAYRMSGGGVMYFSGPKETRPTLVTIPEGSGQFSRIAWSSTNPTVALVAANGSVTSKSKGVATIIGSFTDKWGVKRDLHISVGVENGDEDPGNNPPRYPDFSPNEVLVVLEHSYSHVNLYDDPTTRRYYIPVEESLFAEVADTIGIVSIQDLSAMLINDSADYVIDPVLDTRDPASVKAYEELVNFHQILLFTLKESGKENVLSAIALLEQLDFVTIANPVYDYTLD